MRSRVVFRVLACTLGERLGGRCGDSGAGEDPGTIRHGMESFDLTGFGCPPERLGSDPQELSRLAEVQPWLDPVFGGLEHRDAVIRSHRGDALTGPSVAVAGLKTVAVSNAGDQIVIGNDDELA